MRGMMVAALCAGLLAAGSQGAEAKGCIKGAIVGGVAGHYAGHHGLLGAAAGCVTGRELAKRKAAAKTNPTPTTPATSANPTTAPAAQTPAQ